MRWWTIKIRFFFHSYTIKFRHISMIIISRSHWHTTRPTEKKKFVDYSYIHKFLTQTKNCDVCRWMNINEKKKKKKWKYTTNERTNDWIVLLVSVAGTTANSSSSTDLVYCVAEFGGGGACKLYVQFFSLMCCACLITCLNGCMLDRRKKCAKMICGFSLTTPMNMKPDLFYSVLLMTASEMILNHKIMF